jgi:hypothetical protein
MFIDEDPPDASALPDPPFGLEQFLEWRSPRHGVSNPERMTNPVWRWLAETGIDPFQATQKMKGPSAMDAGPGWTMRRFGQTCTRLPDGRELFIAGEHEDSYDPDFYIYNDAVLRTPAGEIEIFGYPICDFQPTDFHSATLADGRILIIGCLGYEKDRRPGTTPVNALDTSTLKISAVQTTGALPGWIHRHAARLEGNAIILSGGKLQTDRADFPLIENIDDWRLDLRSMRWERLTQRNWPRWSFSRAGGQANDLWKIRHSQFARDHGLADQFAMMNDEYLAKLPELIREEMAQAMAPKTGDVDIATLYTPPIPHEKIPESESEHATYRIVVDGVTIRFVEGFSEVQMTIEGALPPSIVDTLKNHLCNTLAALENTNYKTVQIS